MNYTVNLPAPVVREMIAAAEQAAAYLSNSSEERAAMDQMAAMLKAGLRSINAIMSFADIERLISAESITQEEYESADEWLLDPRYHIPARTYSQLIKSLKKKVK